MGCPTHVKIGDNLVFTVMTHDPDTGVLTDADAVPTYRLYEDETATPILTGSMAKLDDANTTGFYSELIACTSGNGFEAGKSYNIYVIATVDSDQGGICFSFTAHTGDVDSVGLAAEAIAVVHIGVASTGTLWYFRTHLELNGQVVTSGCTNGTLKLYDTDGAQVGSTQSDAAPDAQHEFVFSITNTPVADRVYYAEAKITYGGNDYTSRIAFGTAD